MLGLLGHLEQHGSYGLRPIGGRYGFEGYRRPEDVEVQGTILMKGRASMICTRREKLTVELKRSSSGPCTPPQ